MNHTASYLSTGIPVPPAVHEKEESDQQRRQLYPSSCKRLFKKTKSDPLIFLSLHISNDDPGNGAATTGSQCL